MKFSHLRLILSIIALTTFLGSLETVSAQWSGDSTVNTLISAAFADQKSPVIATDGAGGAIIAWTDDRALSSIDIYAQRIDASGNVLWTADGVAICTAAADQIYPAIVSDGWGGAVITWMDKRSGNFDIYAQRVDASGNVRWTTDGVALCIVGGNQQFPRIISDGAGGAIVTWEDSRTGTVDIYSRRIDGSGTALWTANGVAICTATGSQNTPTLAFDGAGGAIITWFDFRSGTYYHIYAQRVDSTGNVLWATDGVVVCGATNTQMSPAIMSDGAGGAMIVWQDFRNGVDMDVYAQRINSSGVAQWGANGVAVSALASGQDSPVMVSDGAGGAVIAWNDYRNSATADVYAQRINGSGISQWTANGVAISVAPNYQADLVIVGDGASGAIIAWDDQRAGAYDIYAQRVDASGAVQWRASGIPICNAAYTQNYPQMVSDGSGGAILAWQDSRSSTNYDVYASKVFSNGVLPVELTSFNAHPDGSAVELAWKTATEKNNYGFEIERQVLLGSGLESGSQATSIKPQNWARVGFVAGTGASSSPKEYSFADKNLASGWYAYRIKQIDKNGTFKYTQSAEVEVGLAPKAFTLNQNFPNPFNPSTTLEFTFEQNGNATVKIYNMLGQEIATVFDEVAEAGKIYQARFNASRLTSGVYMSVLESGGKRLFRKMLLVK
jgi:hypothetical protein